MDEKSSCLRNRKRKLNTSQQPKRDMTNTTTIRVRYAETDQMGVVYCANFLV